MTVDSRSLMPGWMLRVNRLVINPVQGLWAPYPPPYTIVIHTGGRTGHQTSVPALGF